MTTKWSFAHKLSAVVTLVLLVNGILWFFGWSPASKSLDEAKAERVHLADKKEVKEQQLRELLAIDLEQANQQLQQLNVQVPVEGELREILSQLEYMANLESRLHSIRTGNLNSVEDYFVLNLTVVAEGSYSALYNYLEAIEEHQRLISVESFNLYCDSNDSIDMLMNIKLRLFAENFNIFTPFQAPGRENPFTE